MDFDYEAFFEDVIGVNLDEFLEPNLEPNSEDLQEYETFNIEDELLEIDSDSLVFDFDIDVVIDENFISLRGLVLLHQIVGMALVLMMLLVLNRKATHRHCVRFSKKNHKVGLHQLFRKEIIHETIENTLLMIYKFFSIALSVFKTFLARFGIISMAGTPKNDSTVKAGISNSGIRCWTCWIESCNS